MAVIRTAARVKTMYDYLDEVLKRVVVRIYDAFSRFRCLRFDELHIVGELQDLYSELETINIEAYTTIANYYYRSESKTARTLDRLWLDRVLTTPSEVMKYAYGGEVVRKRDRLLEALIATKGSVAEIDKAMRYWTQMTGWFSVEVADQAVTQAREDIGVAEVMWCSEHDAKVCDYCWKLNKQVFRADAVPPKPHPNCRCWTVDVGRVVSW